MKSRIACVLTLAIAVVAGTAIAKDAAKDAKKKKIDLSKVKCMMSGKACKETAVAEHNDGKVHFCCPNCVKAFKKDSKKWATKANLHLVATKQFKQEKCPLTGGKAKKGTEAKIAGVEVKFCCNNCQKKANSKKGDEQLELVFNDKSFKKAFVVAKKEKKKEKKEEVKTES